MGFSMCGAIGAWFADQTKRIICITGDGGMTMNSQELATIKNYNVNIKIFILNNNIYGITKAFQETNFEGRAEACGPKGYNPPDFEKIASASGIWTERIDKNDPIDIKGRLGIILGYHGPSVINVISNEFHSYYPKISGWKTPIEDMEPYLDRQEFIDNMTIEPLQGW